MHSAEKNKGGDQDSEDEELSENEQKNLENILVLFPYRAMLQTEQKVDDVTFERIKSALSCRICLEVYKDPVYTKDCMHRFCKQCIEKIIRSQQNKSCPFCRTPLGSKRVLRNDFITEHIINKIFPDLKVYLTMEEEQDKHYYSSKIRELQDGAKGRRKNKGDGSPLASVDLKKVLTPTGEKGEKKGGRKSKKEAKMRDELQDEGLERIEKKLKKQSSSVSEVNLLEKNNKKMEEEPISTKTEPTLNKTESVASIQSQETITTKIEASNIKQEVKLERTESKSEKIEPIAEKLESKIEAKTEKIEPKVEKIETKLEKIEPTKMIEKKNESDCQKIIEEFHNDESLLASLKHLMERSDLDEIIMSLDFLTPVIIEPLPSEPYLKHLENPVIKTTSAIKVEQLAKFICKKLNLNEVKYNDRIQLWIKKDNKFESVDRQMKLKDIGNKYWSHLQRIDWEVYDLITHVEEYLNKTTKPVQSERVLYYSVYLDDWL